MLLATIGLYGVISYTVAQRTNEIGIRMALGAQRSGIVGLILGEVAVLIGIGITIGAGLALGGGRAASSLLYGLEANDPLTLALAVILLTAIGLAAIFVPARRASRLDPITALRYEQPRPNRFEPCCSGAALRASVTFVHDPLNPL